MESKVKSTYDAALVLQAVGSVAITTTTTSTKVDINRIAFGRGDIQGRYGEGSFDVVMSIVALDHTTGDETYSLAFTTYDSAGANATTQDTHAFTIADIGNPLRYKFDTATLAEVDSDAAQFAIVATLAGTTPSLQYWAFIAPNLAWG